MKVGLTEARIQVRQLLVQRPEYKMGHFLLHYHLSLEKKKDHFLFHHQRPAYSLEKSFRDHDLCRIYQRPEKGVIIF